MEHIEVLVFFAGSDDLDRPIDYRLDRERGAAAGVTVEFGEHHAGDPEAIVEFFGRFDGILTGHRISDEQDLARAGLALHCLELLHQLVVDVQTSSGVDDHRVVEQRLRFLRGFLRDLDRIALFTDFEERHLDVVGHDAKLIDCRGAVDVGGNEQRPASAILHVQRELARRCRLARAL